MYAVSCSATLSRLSRGFSSLGGTVQLVRERSPTQPPQDRRKTGGIPLLVPKTVPFRAIYTQSASASLTPPLTTPAPCVAQKTTPSQARLCLRGRYRERLRSGD